MHQIAFPDPLMLPHVQADKGAIPFLMSGANCMCAGLTSAGGVLPELPENTIVVKILYYFASESTNALILYYFV